jgi:hypothetical protein
MDQSSLAAAIRPAATQGMPKNKTTGGQNTAPPKTAAWPANAMDEMKSDFMGVIDERRNR